MKIKRATVSGPLKRFSIIVSVFSVITVFDGFHRYLELFAHFKLQYLLASIIFSALFFVLREYKFGCVMIVVAALNLTYVLPWYFESNSDAFTPERIKSENTALNSGVGFATKIKLIQSNVHTNNTNYQALIDLVIEESPDILIAQEVNKQWSIELNKIDDILPYKKVITREDNFGIAIFSKHPFNEAEIIYLGPSNLPSIKIVFTVANQQVSLIASHPLPPINKRFYESRNSQIEEVSVMSREIEQPLIVVGDFNITMWSKDYQQLEEYPNLSNTRKGFGILPTWPANLLPLMIPIDHCLVSSDFKVLDMVVGRNIGSDHLPIIITLGLIE